MTKLKLAPDFALPADAVTETFGILAVRGAGKSSAAAVMAEEMFKAALPFVAVDPVGSWWGLRSSRDGKGPGLPIPIFGGRHGDVPLERGGGQVVADLIVDQRLSCVLDLCSFDSEGAKKQFLVDFAKRLYQRNEAPLHLFLEEADDYIPQRPMRDEPELLRAWENIVRRGRSRGLGMTLITQRSASLNKNVLTQVQTLITLRTTGPQDRDAIAEWVKYHQQSREILESLASLKDGDAWVWSPDFLGKTVRIHFRQRETFDSGATPKALAAATRTPATLADVDLAAISRQMTATIEKAKAEDPKELRRRIAELEREARSLKLQVSSVVPPPAEIQRVEVPVLGKPELHRLEEAAGKVLDAVQSVRQVSVELGAVADGVRQVLDLARGLAARAAIAAAPRPVQTSARPQPAPALRRATPTVSAENRLAPVQQRILDALAELEALGLSPAARPQVALLAEYGHPRSKGFSNSLSALHTAGLIAYAAGLLALTDDGRTRASAAGAPRTSAELQGRVLGKLEPVHARILEPLITVYPRALPREDLAARAGYEHVRSKGFSNALSRLSALGLVSYPATGHAAATAALFLVGA